MQAELNFTQPYFNTIPLTGPELLRSIESAETQEKRIEMFFRCNPDNEFTPFTVLELMDESCINSVRRAITVLCKKGILIKTGNMVAGRFGVKNNCWKINN